MKPAGIFDDIYRDYVRQVASLEMSTLADRLGIQVDGRKARLPLFGQRYEVSPDGIVDQQGNRPSHSVSVVLCKYLLLCPADEPSGDDWVTYRNFRDAAPYVTGFANTAEQPIARLFSGRPSSLHRTAPLLTGRPAEVTISCDLALQFEALPRLPLRLLFNDQDEDFAAECTLLFQSKAEKYLDMECLAIVGAILTEWLKRYDIESS